MTALAAPTDGSSAPDDRGSKERTTGLIAVLAATAFWSFGGVLGKATGVPGVVLGFWRMWIAAAVMTVIILVMKRRPSLLDVRRSLVIGVLFGLNICAFFITLEYVSIAVALIIGALTPVVALPIAVVFMGERLTAMKVGCALVAVAGVVAAVLTAPSGSDDTNSAVGYAWAVASLLIWVAYLLLAKRVRRQVETVRLMWVVSVVGAVTVSILALVLHSPLGEMHGADWVWVTLLALGPGIAGHGLFAWAQPRVDSSVSSVLIQGEPVGASIAAWVFLGETVSVPQALSMGVVLAALGTLAYREARDGIVTVDDGLA